LTGSGEVFALEERSGEPAGGNPGLSGGWGWRGVWGGVVSRRINISETEKLYLNLRGDTVLEEPTGLSGARRDFLCAPRGGTRCK
jgi:hypothetical protein